MIQWLTETHNERVTGVVRGPESDSTVIVSMGTCLFLLFFHLIIPLISPVRASCFGMWWSGIQLRGIIISKKKMYCALAFSWRTDGLLGSSAPSVWVYVGVCERDGKTASSQLIHKWICEPLWMTTSDLFTGVLFGKLQPVKRIIMLLIILSVFHGSQVSSH